MKRARLHICGLTVAALALGACASEEKPGIEVTVDLNGFPVRTLKIAIGTNMGGFKPLAPTSVQNIPVKTEDFDGDGNIDFVTVFSNPTGPIAFRVATDNQVMLNVSGQADAFDDKVLIAAAARTAATPLSPGGRASIALKLVEKTGGVVGPDTRSTDVKTASPDIMVTSGTPAGFSSAAVCYVDGDDKPDLVIGAPLAANLDQNASGAVFVLPGKNGFGSATDLGVPGAGMEFHFYGQFATDQLGAAVACADLDKDGNDDLIIGAPGAHGGAGEVYVILGGPGLPNRQVLGSTGNPPDVTLQSSVDSGFGGKLLARDLDGDKKAEILVGPRTAGAVHLFTKLPLTGGAAISVDNPDHVRFANYNVSSIAAGNLQRAPGGAIDVVIGDTEARMPGMSPKFGAVYAFPSVSLAAKTQYDATTPDPTSTIIYGNESSQFGAATLAVDTTGEGQDLIIGAPGDNTGAGAFYVFKGDSDFFYLRVRPLSERAAFKDGPSMNGRFGAALAGTPNGTRPNYSGGWALLVGAPGTARSNDRPLAGAAYLFAGGSGWPFPLYEEIFGASTGDALGTVVTGGQLDDDAVGDLITLSPAADPNGTGDHNGAVYVRYNHVK